MQPPPVVAAGAGPEQPVSRGRAPRGRGAWALVAALGIVVLVVISVVFLARVVATPGASNVISLPNTPAPIASAAPTEVALVPQVTGMLTATAVLGAGASLSHPQEALGDGQGHIYVADTGNHRVAVLDLQGHLLRAITSGPSGPLQAPYSLALTSQGHLLVLDSDAGQVIEYDQRDNPAHASSKTLSLVHARGIGLDAKGNVLIADPASAAVVTLNPDLTPLHVQPGRLPSGSIVFRQPAAVAGAADGSVYVVDGESNQLLQFAPDWSLRRSWPLPASDTEHAPRPLPLPAGQVAVTDPVGGRLLLYGPAADQPRSFVLTSGQGSAQLPLGLAPFGLPKVLVTASNNGQIWEMRLQLP